MLISRATAQTLYPAVKAGTLEVELGAAWRNTALTAKGPDTLAASSARGVHGSDGFVKPDVAAPERIFIQQVRVAATSRSV